MRALEPGAPSGSAVPRDEIETLEQALVHVERLSATLMEEQRSLLAQLDPLISRFHAASVEWRKVEEFLLRTRELIEVRIERAKKELESAQRCS